MDLHKVERVYTSYASVYDKIFGKVFHEGRESAIRNLNAQPNERILEVGVGTGIALPMYPRHCEIVAIDFSEGMLEIAKKRTVEHQMDHVTLHRMDAGAMDFGDNSFDTVVAAYVITATEGAALHLDRLQTRAGDFEPAIRDRLIAGAMVPAAMVATAQKFRRWYRRPKTANSTNARQQPTMRLSSCSRCTSPSCSGASRASVMKLWCSSLIVCKRSMRTPLQRCCRRSPGERCRSCGDVCAESTSSPKTRLPNRLNSTS